MRLTTKLSHAKIRLKHKALRMRLRNPALYRTLPVLFLLLAVAGSIAIYVLLIAPKNTNTYTEQFDVKIESYSLNGQITAINGNSFTMQGSVVESHDGINSVKSITRTIMYSNTTAIYVTNINGKEVNSRTGQIDDLAVGRSITVYTTEDPGKTPSLSATKLEIIQ